MKTFRSIFIIITSLLYACNEHINTEIITFNFKDLKETVFLVKKYLKPLFSYHL